jgi:hypothetical protein
MKKIYEVPYESPKKDGAVIISAKNKQEALQKAYNIGVVGVDNPKFSNPSIKKR